MTDLTIHDDVQNIINRFKVPDSLGFGQVITPVMYRVDYTNGKWGNGELMPYGSISLDPASKVLHYAQVIFEGLKAYRVVQDRAKIFRPNMNWQRLNSSAERMMMPEIPESLFMESLYSICASCETLIPRQPGQ